MNWSEWVEEDYVKNFKWDPRDTLTNTLITSSENTCRMYLLDMLLQTDNPVMLYGNTGIGKSMEVANLIFHCMDTNFTPCRVNFTKHIEVNLIQESLEQKLQRFKGNQWRPALGDRVIAFIDNINYPKPGKL